MTTVARDLRPTSPWLPDLLAAMGAHRLAVLDGGVDDDALVLGEPTGIVGAIAAAWREVSDAIVLRWSPRGLEPVDEEERERLQRVTALRPPGDALACVVNDPLAGRDPLDVADTLRRLLARDEERVAVVVEHADLLLAGGPDPYSRRVTAATLTAVEAFEEASELHALVLLCRDLGALPSAVVQRPGVARLRVPAPDVEARAVVAGLTFDRPARDPQIERLAVTSDGLALREVALLAGHARATRIEVGQPRELVSSFRHGHRVDPWAALTDERMREVGDGIRSQVFGQPRAVAEALERLEVARSGLELEPPTSGTRKSRLELFLVGPTGVGKNELARAFAWKLFGDRGAVMTFDMSAFQQEHSGEQLFGAPPGYVGHEHGSPLVDHVREHPFSVMVFDEFEKAHPNCWLRLMAAVDEGRVTDTRGVQASLEDAIIIFTSNIGGDVLLERAQRGPMTTEAVEQLTIGLVEQHLSHSRYEVDGQVREGLGKPEVWGRLQGSLIAFDLLREDAVASIVERFCLTLAASARKARRVNVEIDAESVTAAVADRLGMPGTWNGRLIKGHVDRLVRRPLAHALSAERFGPEAHVRVSLGADERLVVEVSR